MAHNQDLKELMTTLNRANAEIQSLKEQMRQKDEAWERVNIQTGRTIDLARSLCEKILAKDRKEMKLKAAYSWNQIPTDELIKKAVHSYDSYNEERKGVLDRLLQEVEMRGAKVQGLEEQIMSIMSGNKDAYKTAQEVIEDVERKSVQKAGFDNSPYDLKQAAKEGQIELIVEDDEDAETVLEAKQIDGLMEVNEQIKTTSQSIPVAESFKKREMKKKRRDEKIIAHVVNLAEFRDKMSDTMWDILYVIGHDGISIYSDIEGKVLERNPNILPSRVRTAMTACDTIGVVAKEEMRLPISSKMFAYRLSDIGERIYQEHFSERPIACELDKVIAEHDNPEHGYGIMEIAQVLQAKGWYAEISTNNRKKAIKLESNKRYIPDIIGTTAQGINEYFEYERGTHTQADFNDKCNKMIKVTRTLYFITPNKDTIKKIIKPKIENWIASRGKNEAQIKESLRNITIKIGTASSIKDAKEKKSEPWFVVYNINQKITPVKDLTVKNQANET